MTGQSYARTVTVQASPEDAYRALTTGYGHWWTPCDVTFNKVGDRIKFAFPPHVSYWMFEAKKLEPNSMVELECVEAYHEILDKPDADKTEWLGSKARFRIEPNDERTTIHFTHDGLTPDLHCYEVCEAGWDLFFVDSLKAYLDTGVGKPFQADQDGKS